MGDRMPNEEIILYQDEHFFSSFPAVTKASNGDILVFFRRARDTRFLLTENSANQLEEMSQRFDHVDPRSEIYVIRYDESLRKIAGPLPTGTAPEAADQDPSVLTLSDGSMLLSSFSWYPCPGEFFPIFEREQRFFVGDPFSTGTVYLFWGGFTRKSHDGGLTWSPHCFLPPLPEGLDIIPGRRPHLGGAVRGAMVEREGKVLLATYAIAPKLSEYYSSHLLESADFGESFIYRGLIASNETAGFSEPALCLLDDGRIIAFLRTHGLEGKLAYITSDDGGISWSKPILSRIRGHPFHPLKLSDGRIFLSYGHREEPFGVRAKLISPDLSDLDSTPEIHVCENGLCADVGYPWSTQLTDSTVLTVYYFSRSGKSIRYIGARIIDV